jgi:hypothetical protein
MMMPQMLSKNLFIFIISFLFSATTINSQQWYAEYCAENEPQTQPMPEVCEEEFA